MLASEVEASPPQITFIISTLSTLFQTYFSPYLLYVPKKTNQVPFLFLGFNPLLTLHLVAIPQFPLF